MATCARTGWGTRQNGAEVSLTTEAPPHLEVPAAGSRTPLPDDTTLTIPVVKLLDPDTETTLQIAVPAR